MARIAIVSQWLLGHIVPALGVGAELAGRGHEVCVLSPPAFQHLVEQAGLTYIEVTRGKYPHKFMAETLREMHAALKAVQADIVVCDSALSAPAYVAEKNGMRWISYQTSPYWPDYLVPGVPAVNERLRALYAKELDELRAGYGLPPISDPMRTRGDLAGISPYLHLMMFLEALLPQGIALPAASRVVGPCGFEPPTAANHGRSPVAGAGAGRAALGSAAAAAAAEQAADPGRVAASALSAVEGERLASGSALSAAETGPIVSDRGPAASSRHWRIASRRPHLVICTSSADKPGYRQITRNYVAGALQAFSGSEIDLTVLAHLPYAEETPLPANVQWLTEYPNHHLVFPRADLILTHGGCGTLQKAVQYGVPMIIIPLGADHILVARQCEALGLARVLEPERIDAEMLRRIVRQGLEDIEWKKRVGRFAAQGNVNRSHRLSADEIERVWRGEKDDIGRTIHSYH